MGFLAFISAIYIVYKLLKEALEKPVPAKPKEIKSWLDLPKDTVVDVERYEHDKKVHGEAYAEATRKAGDYRFVMKHYW